MPADDDSQSTDVMRMCSDLSEVTNVPVKLLGGGIKIKGKEKRKKEKKCRDDAEKKEESDVCFAS